MAIFITGATSGKNQLPLCYALKLPDSALQSSSEGSDRSVRITFSREVRMIMKLIEACGTKNSGL